MAARMGTATIKTLAREKGYFMSPEERQAEKGKLLEEHQRVNEEYLLMREQAHRLGKTMLEVGAALSNSPETLFVVPPSPSVIPRPDWVIVTEHPPTLLTIEQLTDKIRAANERLTGLRRTLGALGVTV
jgi:hypothetical protein